ncbi:TetR/AcrR family transcriptional regulator [Thermodesulfobacteriota bacterium]
MPKIRRGRQHQEKHNEILKHAAALFKEKGYNGVTMDQIAQAMGLSKLSIYYYFESKEDLLFSINDIAHSRLLKNMDKILPADHDPAKKLKMALINHINILLSELSPETAALRQHHSLSPENRQRLIKKRDKYDRKFQQVIVDGIKQGVFIDCNPKLAYFAIIGSAGHIVHWYSPGGKFSIEQIADYFAEFLIRALLKEPPADTPKPPSPV